MARALTPTKLPLDTWARIMGLHPLNFNQVFLPDAPRNVCTEIYFQNEWQNSDHVSREEIARAIADAEAKIESHLGYRLAPTWEVDEWRDTIRFFKKEMVNFNSVDARGYEQSVNANWGYFISGGIKGLVVIDAGSAIVYSDQDSDGYDETATVTVATTVTDPSEITIFYPGQDGDDDWEIRPIHCLIAGGIATIVFRRELAVLPELLDTFLPEGVDGTDDAMFLATVDVYRRFNDPSTQVSFLWEPLAFFCGQCSGGGCTACAYATQTGCLMARGDPRSSIVAYSPATWNQDTSLFDFASWAVQRQPDIARLYYYSGWRNKRRSNTKILDPDWERVVAYMAAAMLDRPPCDCAKGDWSRWREDLTIYAGGEDGQAFYRSPVGVLDNPFGSRRGEVVAWRKVRFERRVQAVVL